MTADFVELLSHRSIAWILGLIEDARLEKLALPDNNSYGRYIQGLMK